MTLFIPSKDRDGVDIDQRRWSDQALECFGELFRGATAFPPGRGVWRDDSRNGELLYEETIMVVAYVSVEALDSGLFKLRQFLHRFGREANQGEVGIIISSEYHGISVYDAPAGDTNA